MLSPEPSTEWVSLHERRHTRLVLQRSKNTKSIFELINNKNRITVFILFQQLRGGLLHDGVNCNWIHTLQQLFSRPQGRKIRFITKHQFFRFLTEFWFNDCIDLLPIITKGTLKSLVFGKKNIFIFFHIFFLEKTKNFITNQ